MKKKKKTFRLNKKERSGHVEKKKKNVQVTRKRERERERENVQVTLIKTKNWEGITVKLH